MNHYINFESLKVLNGKRFTTEPVYASNQFNEKYQDTLLSVKLFIF